CRLGSRCVHPRCARARYRLPQLITDASVDPSPPSRRGVDKRPVLREPAASCAVRERAPDTPEPDQGGKSPIAFLRLSSGFGAAPCAGAIVRTSRLFMLMTR